MEPKKYYWIYQLALSENSYDELESHIRSGRAEYVAGKLMGMLKLNGKIVYPQSRLASNDGPNVEKEKKGK